MPTFVAHRLPHVEVTRRNAVSNPHLPREPGLINLPIPLPSIPLLDPLITPLVGGNNRPSPTATNPPATTPPTTTGGGSQPPTTGGGGGGGGGTGTGGSGGSSGGDPGSSSTSGSTGNGSGNGGGGVTITGPDHTPSGTTDSGGAPSSSSSGGDFLSDGNAPVNAGNDPADSDGSQGGSSHSGNGGNSGIVTTQAGITVDIPGVSGTPRTGGNEGGGGSGGGGGDTAGSGAVKKHGGLSGGAVAGIIVLVILIIVATSFFIVRRRFRNRRNERRKNWWFSRNKDVQTYGDRAHGDAEIPGSAVAGGIGGGTAALRRSMRSSFETTVDHSQTPRLDLDFDIPALPPMAELRGTPMLINLDTPISPVNRSRPPQINITTTPDSRFSVGSISSVGSDGQGQWLVVNRDSHLTPEIGTPMSVRPFSPTESFAFPKPPTDKSSGDWSQPSRPASSNTLGASITGGLKSPGIAGDDVPALPLPSPAANPFNDPDPIALHAATVAALGVAPSHRIDVAAANSLDPFADPTLPPEPTTPSSVHPEFMEVEIVRRPFIPSLDDELAVDVGDKVKILQMFDDGWALVEKNPIYGLASVKGKGREPETGLIPIDCFRDHGLDLSAFIASKRVSSYSQSSGKYTAGGAAF